MTKLLTTAEAAARRGVDVSTVARWVSRGVLKPAIRLPGVRGPMLFRVADVDAVVIDPRRKAS